MSPSKDILRRILSAGYDAGERSRHTSMLGAGRQAPRSEDKLLGQNSLTIIRQNCMNLVRNNAIVAGVKERFADNVVGSGITPQAKTKDKAWNEKAEQFFRQWSKIIDVRRRVDMREMQRIIVGNRLIVGDELLVTTKGGQLEPIEGERILTPDDKRTDPNTVLGCKIHPKFGFIQGYHVFDRGDNGGISIGTDKSKFIKAESAFFPSAPIRFDQVRTIPTLAPVTNALKQIDMLTDSMLERAQMDAMRAWFVPQAGGAGPGGGLGPRRSGGTTDTSDVGGVPREKFESGMTYYGRDKEGAPISLASNTPNNQYIPFLMMNLRIVGAALSLPYEFLLMDFSQGNFSASRAALLQTYRTFTGWQEWLVSQFLRPVWNWRIARAIKHGELEPAPIVEGVSQWFQVDWSFPEFGWIDPNSEALSESREFALGKRTMHDIISKGGGDFDETMDVKELELRDAQSRAAKLNKEFGIEIFNWTDFINASVVMSHQKLEGSTAAADGGVKEG